MLKFCLHNAKIRTWILKLGGIMFEKAYTCIDLKSFYASVECVELGKDPFTTNLVVADSSRGQGAICLAVTPALKKQGVKNRCRLYQIPSNIPYIIAMPRMKLYMEYSAAIYATYLEYLSPDDIHVYSIDECFMDFTPYTRMYGLTPREFASKLIEEIKRRFNICATAGVGTNLFLAKLALDITAKHAEDNMGYLDEELFKQQLWHHRPLTDIWNIGKAIARRLAHYGVYDLYGVAHLPESLLYKEFGINARFLIDHAWGRESCTIKDIHDYKPLANTISNGQILFEDYDFDNGLVIMKEMVELLSLELVEKHLSAAGIGLSVSYSKNCYPRTGGVRKLPQRTDSLRVLLNGFVRLYGETTNRNQAIRQVQVWVTKVSANFMEEQELFVSQKAEDYEKDVQIAMTNIKKRFGKTAIMRGLSYREKATGLQRSKLIGGHNSG